MIVGFTGTRKGMTDRQKHTFEIFMDEYNPEEFHHGDCIGADMEAHNIVRNHCPRSKIIGHPPNFDTYRAFCLFDQQMIPTDYLSRNREIVVKSSILLATPKEATEQFKGGTWYTVRYARMRLKTIRIILPDGSYIKEGPEDKLF